MIKKLSVWSGDHWVGLEKETASQTIFSPHIHICQKKSQLHLFQDNRKTQNASKNDQRWHNLPQVLVRIIESLDTLIDILTMHYGLLRPLTFLSGKKTKTFFPKLHKRFTITMCDFHTSLTLFYQYVQYFKIYWATWRIVKYFRSLLNL